MTKKTIHLRKLEGWDIVKALTIYGFVDFFAVLLLYGFFGIPETYAKFISIILGFLSAYPFVINEEIIDPLKPKFSIRKLLFILLLITLTLKFITTIIKLYIASLVIPQ